MKELLEVRFLVESTEGTFCVSGYVLEDGKMLLTEGDGEVHTLPIESVIHVVKETITKEDITEKIKEQEDIVLV